MRNLWKRTGAVLLSLVTVFALLCPWSAATADDASIPAQQEAAQRKRLIILLDASLSLSKEYMDHGVKHIPTDPEGLRFDAIEGFMNYLRKQENMSEYEIGYVIYANDVAHYVPAQPLTATTPDLSRATMEALSKQDKSKGEQGFRTWTNTGAGLEKAVDLALQDNSNTSAAVLLFSDGKTEMDTTEKLAQSHTRKNAAYQKAVKEHVTIYTLLLNSDNQAGEEGKVEMSAISTDPAHYCKEINSKNQLVDELFKSLAECVGKNIINVPDPDKPPLSVPLDVPFTVPGFGLRSMQIELVTGSFDKLSVVELTCKDPGEDEDLQKVRTQSELVQPGINYITVPLRNAPHNWLLHLESDKEESVRLRLISDEDLTVNLTLPEGELNAAKSVTARVTLTSRGVTADKAEQYQGFAAELMVRDDNQKPVDTISMTPAGADGFTAEFKLKEPQPGTYRFAAYVSSSDNLIIKDASAGGEREFSIDTIKETSPWVTRTFVDISTPPVVKGTEESPVVVTLPPDGAQVEIDLSGYVSDSGDDNPDGLTFEITHTPEGVEAQCIDGRLYVRSVGMENGMFEGVLMNAALEQDNVIAIQVTNASGKSEMLYLQLEMPAPTPTPVVKGTLESPVVVTLPENGEIDLRDYVSGSGDGNDTLTFQKNQYPDGAEADLNPDGKLHVRNVGAEDGVFAFDVTNSSEGTSTLYLSVKAAPVPPTVPADGYKVTVTRGKRVSVDVSKLVTDDRDAWEDMNFTTSPEDGSPDFTAAPTQSDAHFIIEKATENGSYVVKVTDSDGLSSSFTIVVTTKAPFPWLWLILFALIVAIIVWRIWEDTRPFYGDIIVTTSVNGVIKEDLRSPKKGKFYLSMFSLGDLQNDFKLNPGKCVFRPAGNRSIVLTLHRAAHIIGGATSQYKSPGKKVRVQSGAGSATITFPELPNQFIKVRFESHEKKKSGAPGGRTSVSGGGGFSQPVPLKKPVSLKKRKP